MSSASSPRSRLVAVFAALVAASVCAVAHGQGEAPDIPYPHDEPYPATVILKDGSKLIGRVSKVERGHITVDTWYKKVTVQTSKVASVQPGPGAVMLAGRRKLTETINFLTAIERGKPETEALLARTFEAMGRHNATTGYQHVSIVRGVRIGGDFAVQVKPEGKGELLYFIPRVSVRGKRVLDPAVVRNATRLKPGTKVKLHYHIRKLDSSFRGQTPAWTGQRTRYVWLDPGKAGIVVPDSLGGEYSPALCELIERLKPGERERLKGLNCIEGKRNLQVPEADNPTARPAMLLLAAKLDSCVEPALSIEVLVRLMHEAGPAKVPAEVYDALVRVMFRLDDYSISDAAATLLVWSEYRDFAPILATAAGHVRGPAASRLAKLAQQLNKSQRRLLGPTAGLRRDGPPEGGPLATARKLAASDDLAHVSKGAEILLKHGKKAEAVDAHMKARNYWEAGHILKGMGAKGPARDLFVDEMLLRKGNNSDFNKKRSAKAGHLAEMLDKELAGDKGWAIGRVEWLAEDGSALTVRVQKTDGGHSPLVGLAVKIKAERKKRGAHPHPGQVKLIRQARKGDTIKCHFHWQGHYQPDSIWRVEPINDNDLGAGGKTSSSLSPDTVEAERLLLSSDLGELAKAASIFEAAGDFKQAALATHRSGRYLEAGQMALAKFDVGIAADFFLDEMLYQEKKLKTPGSPRFLMAEKHYNKLTAKLKGDKGWSTGTVRNVAPNGTVMVLQIEKSDAKHRGNENLPVRFVVGTVPTEAGPRPNPKQTAMVKALRPGNRIRIHYTWDGRRVIESIVAVGRSDAGRVGGGRAGYGK